MSATSLHPVSVSVPPDRVMEIAAGLVGNVRRVVKGHDEAVFVVVAALLAGGHVLIEDAPGTGKTTLAKALAASVGGVFHRVQGTADLLPTDITGSNVWDQSQGIFTFIPGPIFAHVLLVDEINRTPPRTQSAFLEVMEEGAATIDGNRYEVPKPFFLVATQNPTEQYGTYPLPESQLDRFAVRVALGHIAADDELTVVRDQLVRPTVDALTPVVDVEELCSIQTAIRQTYVTEAVLAYAVDLVRATRQDSHLLLGASSRAAITLVRLAQGFAAVSGRDFVTPGDVKAMAIPVLAHRVEVSSAATIPAVVIAELVQRLAIPIQG
jgi:MoxR-like ATPase